MKVAGFRHNPEQVPRGFSDYQLQAHHLFWADLGLLTSLGLHLPSYKLGLLIEMSSHPT